MNRRRLGFLALTVACMSFGLVAGVTALSRASATAPVLATSATEATDATVHRDQGLVVSVRSDMLTIVRKDGVRRTFLIPETFRRVVAIEHLRALRDGGDAAVVLFRTRDGADEAIGLSLHS